MPAKSQQQFKFMKMVELGKIKKPGLSPDKAKEYTESVSFKDLPKVIPEKKKRFKKLLDLP